MKFTSLAFLTIAVIIWAEAAVNADPCRIGVPFEKQPPLYKLIKSEWPGIWFTQAINTDRNDKTIRYDTSRITASFPPGEGVFVEGGNSTLDGVVVQVTRQKKGEKDRYNAYKVGHRETCTYLVDPELEKREIVEIGVVPLANTW